MNHLGLSYIETNTLKLGMQLSQHAAWNIKSSKLTKALTVSYTIIGQPKA